MSHKARYTLPKSVFHDFNEDIADLMDASRGVDKQTEGHQQDAMGVLQMDIITRSSAVILHEAVRLML